MTSNLCNNLIITKVWQDSTEPFFLIEVEASSPVAMIIHEGSYTSVKNFVDAVDRLLNFVNMFPEELCITLTYLSTSPGVALRFIPKDPLGHVFIEVDLPILDVEDESHRGKFFIESELGQIERFAKRLKNMSQKEVGYSVALHDDC